MGGIDIIMALVSTERGSTITKIVCHDAIKGNTKFYNICIKDYPYKETDPI